MYYTERKPKNKNGGGLGTRLPRYRKPPTKPGDVSAASHEFATPQSYFRRQYYEALDLVTNELKRRFQQKRGLPVAAVIEKTMLAAAGGSLEQVPDDFQIYKNDLDLARLQIQLQILPDLIRTRNMKLSNDIPIRKVTNVRTLCEVMNEVPMSKGMFSEVLRLIKIFYNCRSRTNIFCPKEIENIFKSYNVTATTQQHHASLCSQGQNRQN